MVYVNCVLHCGAIVNTCASEQEETPGHMEPLVTDHKGACVGVWVSYPVTLNRNIQRQFTLIN